MAAFLKARESGAPGLELDVHLCAPGKKPGESASKLVVAHDDTFKRTTQRTAPPEANGRGLPIEELCWEEIKEIDVGSFFGPSFRNAHTPLLEDVLETFCPGMYIDIEMKSRKTKADPLPAALAEALLKAGEKVLKAVTVSSFNPLALLTFKKLCPQVPTAVIYCVDKEVPLLLRRGLGRFIARCDYLKPIHSQVTPFSRFRLARLEGHPLVPWTIDDPAIAEKMLRLGCEGIITNRPQDMPFPRPAPLGYS
jgi:glycerophosphoryl diester phosphodiesterase